jgi:hypothetical protein
MPDSIPSPLRDLPDPQHIRRRLSDLADEADLLCALLRLLERRECGRRLLRRRRQAAAPVRQQEGPAHVA